MLPATQALPSSGQHSWLKHSTNQTATLSARYLLHSTQALPSSGQYTQLKHSTIQTAILLAVTSSTGTPIIRATYPAQTFNNSDNHTFSTLLAAQALP